MRSEPTTVVRRIGQPPSYTRNIYAKLLMAKWRTVLAAFLAAYLVASLFFAALYYAGGDCIANAEPGSFRDVFFLSVQTISTIGFGALYPKTVYANIVVFFESFTALLLVALATGLVFAKFSRPSAGVLFCDKVVIGNRNGEPTLMIRVANARGGDLVEASVSVTALMNELTREGERLRKLHDLELIRSRTPVFAMSWTIMHRLDEKSPLFGMTPDDFTREDLRLIVNLTGIDGTFNQTVYAFRTYGHQAIERDALFVDVILPQPDGTFILDLTKFHQTRPMG